MLPTQCEQFSFYAVRDDQTVVAWDLLETNYGAAIDHAHEMVARYPEAARIEVWDFAQPCFSVPANLYRRAEASAASFEPPE